MKNCDQLFEELGKFLESDQYKRIQECKNIVIFGAGHHGSIALEYFQSKNIEVFAYCDNNTQKQGQMFNGFQCISPEQLKNLDSTFVFIAAHQYGHLIEKQLQKMDIECMIFDKYAFSLEMQGLKFLIDLLDDRTSISTIEAIIESRVYGNNSRIKEIFIKEKYFCLPEFSDINPNEVIIDCGAYVGDTMEQYIFDRFGLFKRYYAFEPDLKIFNALKIRENRLINEWALREDQIICVNSGVGADNKVGYVDNNLEVVSGSKLQGELISSENKVEIIKLDSFINMESVSMIKADVEGYELEMIHGATGIIISNKPKMAISIYHKIEDLFSIADYIKEIVPEYKFAIRHHSTSFSETVLYCWV